MPIYQYQCEFCETIFEQLFNKPSDKKIECPKCKRSAKKIPARSTFVLKGCGWASDGYNSKK